MTIQDRREIESIVKKILSESIVQKKTGDTPLEAFDLVNKRYVDGKSSSSLNGRSHGTATTSIPGGFTPTRVDYNANDFANGITWDGINHRFKAIKAGQYIVTASVGYNGANANNQYEIAIYQNGGQVDAARQQASVGGSVLNINVTDILNLAVNDYVEAYTQHGDAGAVNIFNSSVYTWITIAKV